VSRSLPVLGKGDQEATGTDCWNRIGVGGDRSCPALPAAIHCRNCAVFGEAGRRLLERAPPDGYLDEWTRRLAADPVDSRLKEHSVLLFRLGAEWLALDTRFFLEATMPRPIRRVPHARSSLLLGLVNIRGRLELCVALEEVLTLDRAAAPPSASPRMLVVEHERKGWVFQADEVHGVQHFSSQDVSPLPATVQRGPQSHARSLLRWGERKVGHLDGEKLFRTLEESVA
jgi:chemotaxis-related protein WspD